MKASLHPSRTVALLFLAVIVAGTLLLMLPHASADGQSAATACRGTRRPGAGCSMRCRRSTTPASRSTPTA